MKSFFILPLNIHLIKLLSNSEVRHEVVLYLMQLFSGKLNLWAVPQVPLITNFYVAEREKWLKSDENTSIAKSLGSEPLVISGCCND